MTKCSPSVINLFLPPVEETAPVLSHPLCNLQPNFHLGFHWQATEMEVLLHCTTLSSGIKFGQIFLTTCLSFISTSLVKSLFFFIIYLFIYLLILVVFVIHWHESAMDIHVFPIPIPPPTSLSTRSLWVWWSHFCRSSAFSLWKLWDRQNVCYFS